MNYLYHIVPANLEGNILMPLNILKKVHPRIYDEEIRKYEGRNKILKIKVTNLDCLWNDVIHLTAVHPLELVTAMKKSGGSPSRRKWFKINPKLLDMKMTSVFFNKKFEKFNINKMEKYNIIPKATRNYYKECYEKRQLPLIFQYIPHILYKGTLNLEAMEVIEA